MLPVYVNANKYEKGDMVQMAQNRQFGIMRFWVQFLRMRLPMPLFASISLVLGQEPSLYQKK